MIHQNNLPKPPSNVLKYERRHPLDAIFSPRNVAVIGATETTSSVGRTILWNLISSPFGGTVFPINLKRSSVLGIKAYPSIRAVADPVDLAVIVTPASTVPGVIDECVGAGVQGAIIISAGFKETGAGGARLEQHILDRARGHLRIIGPNCLGVMSPLTGLNATFASTMAQPGHVAFVSQSGALCTAVLDWSLSEHVGFSHFVSIGSMLDVNWGDLIEYLGDDRRTKSIVLYMESIGNARAFLSAAREVALSKPIIVIKAGRTEQAAKAAASHTGALTGSDEVLEAAFRRSGVLRVGRISELFYMAEVLSKQPRPAGPRLTILTNAGGPGVLATDALIADGGQLAALTDQAVSDYNALLPPHWSHSNPVDILGDADPERYAKALSIAAQNTESDGTLVILTPQAMTDPSQTAERLKEHATASAKPVLASWMGAAEVAGGVQILNRADIPTFPYPDTAARIFTYMWRYTDNLRGLYETPVLPSALEDVSARARAAAILDAARGAGRTLLTEFESKAMLASYGIPVVETRIAETDDAAVAAARDLGYPVVLKLHSHTITHKTDVGGVRLNLTIDDEVRDAFRAIERAVGTRTGAGHFLGVTVQKMMPLDGYEAIIGSSVDPQFGPVLLFGSGGKLVEVFRDRALALPPLTTTLARRMMERTKMFQALKGVRGERSCDLASLERLLVRFGELVVEQPWIAEIDINPLLISPERLLALDARVVLHPPDRAPESLPRPAIRPYPTKYVADWTTSRGESLTIRPIRPEDEPLMVRFHTGISDRSVYFRYLHMMNLDARVTHERLVRMCFIDYAHEMALVADRVDPVTGEHDILGVGRLVRIHGTNDGEFALLVTDKLQGHGIGTELLRRLVQVGRDEKLDRIVASIDPENEDMARVSKKVGFTVTYDAEERLLEAELALGTLATSQADQR